MTLFSFKKKGRGNGVLTRLFDVHVTYINYGIGVYKKLPPLWRCWNFHMIAIRIWTLVIITKFATLKINWTIPIRTGNHVTNYDIFLISMLCHEKSKPNSLSSHTVALQFVNPNNALSYVLSFLITCIFILI